MALCDYRPCPVHGVGVPHTNGICDGCRNETAKIERDNVKSNWEVMSIEQKLDYLHDKIK